MAKFEKGNKYSRGGKKGNKGGRPTRFEAQLKKLAAEMVTKRLEEALGSIIDAYISLATGMPVGNQRRKLDPATCRHAVERFIGPAPRKLILDAQETVESFFEQLEKASSKGSGE